MTELMVIKVGKSQAGCMRDWIERESSGRNMKSNSKEQAEWGSATGRAEVTEVGGKTQHLQ